MFFVDATTAATPMPFFVAEQATVVWRIPAQPNPCARRRANGSRATRIRPPRKPCKQVDFAWPWCDSADAAEASTRAGVVRLIGFALKDAAARYEKGPPGFAQMAVALRAVVPPDRLLADVLGAVRDRLMVTHRFPLTAADQAHLEYVLSATRNEQASAVLHGRRLVSRA